MTQTEDRVQKTEDRGQSIELHRSLAWLGLLSAAFWVCGAAAEVARPAYTPPPPAVSSGNILQVVFSLLLVLAVIVLVAWLLKRMNVVQQSTGQLLKVLGGVSIGQRERLVLVEIEDTWLVIGVGPGQIRTLHTMQRVEDLEPGTKQVTRNPALAENKFASLLSSVLKSRTTGNK